LVIFSGDYFPGDYLLSSKERNLPGGYRMIGRANIAEVTSSRSDSLRLLFRSRCRHLPPPPLGSSDGAEPTRVKGLPVDPSPMPTASRLGWKLASSTPFNNTQSDAPMPDTRRRTADMSKTRRPINLTPVLPVKPSPRISP